MLDGSQPLLLLAAVVVVLAVIVGLLVLVRIWRRDEGAVALDAYFAHWQEALWPGSARRRRRHRDALALRARAADPDEAAHAATLLNEMRAGPWRRPLDWQHRRGVPVHPA